MRLAVAVCIFAALAAAPTARAEELLNCHGVTEFVGGAARPVPNVTRHLITLDEFKEIVLFDQTTLGLGVANDAIVTGSAEAPGSHGQEKFSLYLDRQSGEFRYTIATDGQPRFTWRLDGVCALERGETRF